VILVTFELLTGCRGRPRCGDVGCDLPVYFRTVVFLPHPLTPERGATGPDNTLTVMEPPDPGRATRGGEASAIAGTGHSAYKSLGGPHARLPQIVKLAICKAYVDFGHA